MSINFTYSFDDIELDVDATCICLGSPDVIHADPDDSWEGDAEEWEIITTSEGQPFDIDNVKVNGELLVNILIEEAKKYDY